MKHYEWWNDRCLECNAPLKGSWTIHSADCTVYRMLMSCMSIFKDDEYAWAWESDPPTDKVQ